MIRRAFTKYERQQIAAKTNGRCAYCGVDLPKRWHVDHIIPLANSKGTNDLGNCCASCPACNNFKNVFDLELFRSELSSQVERAKKYSINFRMAERFGLIQIVDKPIVFYFETLQ